MTRGLILSVTLGLALLAGCALTPRSGEASRWLYRTADAGQPMALYGPPESEAFLVLECLRPERAIAFRTVDVEPFAGTRPITIRIGTARFVGAEQLEPGEGMAISRSLIPLAHAVVDELARGRGPLIVGAAGRRGRVPGGDVLVRLVAACRETPAQ